MLVSWDSVGGCESCPGRARWSRRAATTESVGPDRGGSHAGPRIPDRAGREHPAGPAARGDEGRGRGTGPGRAGQGGVLQPGRLGQGPDRAADGGGGGGVRRAAPGRHHRGAHLREHRGRPGHRGRAEGLSVRVRLPGQGRPGQDQRAAGLRRRGRGLPGHGVPRAPRFLLLGVQPAGPGDPGRLEAGPVRQPGEPGLALPLHRPGDLGPDRRPGHPLRGRASARAAPSPGPAGTSRRCPAAGSG